MTTAAVSTPPPIDLSRRGLDLTALWTLYLLTLRQNLRGRRWIVMSLLFLLPSALSILIRCTSPNVPAIGIEFVFAFMLIPQALLPLVALVYASGMLQDDQEEQTITYLLIRPIPRWALYLVKLLATLTTTVALTAIFTTLTYAAVYIGNSDQADHLIRRCLVAVSIHSLAVITYCCLFGLVSMLTRRTLVIGILYTAIFEGLLANIPLSVRLITVIYYTRLIAYRTLSFVAHIPGAGNQNLAADAWQLDLQHDPLLLEHPDRRTCVLVLLCASVVFALIAAFLCSRREFYVKTPEKS